VAISNLTDEIASVALLPRNDILRFGHFGHLNFEIVSGFDVPNSIFEILFD